MSNVFRNSVGNNDVKKNIHNTNICSEENEDADDCTMKFLNLMFSA